MACGAAVLEVSEGRVAKAKTKVRAGRKSAKGAALRVPGSASRLQGVARAMDARTGTRGVVGKSPLRGCGSKSAWLTAALEASLRAKYATNARPGVLRAVTAKRLMARNSVSAPHLVRSEASARIAMRFAVGAARGPVSGWLAAGRVASVTRIGAKHATSADPRREQGFRSVRPGGHNEASMGLGLTLGAEDRRRVFVFGSAR
jgi:hypothetical protein